MKTKIASITLSMLVLMLLFTACGGAAVPEEPAPVQQPEAAVPAETPAPIEAPAPTEAPPPIPCRIAYDSEGDDNREIFVMEPDGSNQTNLTNHAANDFDPVWSPDGEAIAFLSDRGNDQGDGCYVFLMKADGSGVKQLSTMPDSAYPDWSPEGRQIAFSHNNDIYVINTDGSGETNLTNSEEGDVQPKFSPGGQRIAWIKGNGNDNFIYVMNTDGSDPQQVTTGGQIYNLEWSVDGRIFAHWAQPEGICGACILNADGSGVMDTGGKGAIQEFLPFWTLDGQRVEMISAQIQEVGGEDDEIYLVGEIFPDIFLNLTDNEVQDGNADAPAKCGPGKSSEKEVEQPEQIVAMGDMVIGYVIRGDNPLKEEQVLKACRELKVTCVRGENVSQLTEQNVSAIVDVSNRWDVLGSFHEIQEARGKFIPLFIVDAETHVNGAYNLSVESDTVHIILEWMFNQMGGEGEMIYYNLGNNGFHQELIDAELEKYPGIQATSLPADFGKEMYTEESIAQMVKENPDLEAIWTSGDMGSIFWGLNSISIVKQLPLIISPERVDFLQAWKQRIDGDSAYSCISTIGPGGAAYEGVYVAYYVLSGAVIDPQMLTGAYGNTLRYDFPVITNENLEEWLGKLDTLQIGEWDFLKIPPMTPEEIKEKWFLE